MGEYRLQSSWHITASPQRVYDALADVERYPTWWPQVLRGVQLHDGVGEITCRSLLPMTLTFVASRVVEDPVGLRLRANLGGDLSGTAEWRISTDGSGSVAVFDEVVTLTKTPGRLLGAVGRPVFIANHAAMMRAGERGLRRRLDNHAGP